MSIVFAFLLLALPAAVSAAKDPIYTAQSLPYLAPGEALSEGESLERRFEFRDRGVYYLWIQAGAGENGARLSYDLDGIQPLKGERGRFKVPAGAPAWLSLSAQAAFQASVNVPAPGAYTLRLRSVSGKVQIQRLALSPYFSAVAKGDSLDHTDDPGGGRVGFPDGPLKGVGFQADWPSPEIEALRRFYVDDTGGDDRRDGLSPQTAWRSLTRVNRVRLQPGDAILLKRGSSWNEGLRPKGNGSPEHPISVGAYAEGPRPRIDGGARHAVHLRDQSHWVVQDLELTSDPALKRCGLMAEASKGGPQARGLRLRNLVAYDNGAEGINVACAWERSDATDDVVIDNCLAFMNGETGVQVGGPRQGGWRNLSVRRVTAYDNSGMGGIYVNGGEHGLIENCLLYGNYFINCWIWNASNMTLRRIEASRGHSGGEQGGFDVDYSCHGNTVEQCHSRHNQGYGFMLMGAGYEVHSWGSKRSLNNVMRYCLAEEDFNPIWAILTLQNSLIHNNLAIARGKGRVALNVGGWRGKDADWPSGIFSYNNVLVASQGALPLWLEGPAFGRNCRVDHNLYFNPEGPLARLGGSRIDPWHDTSYQDFFSLADFRACAGQEENGLEGDPRLEGYWQGDGSPGLQEGLPTQEDEAWMAAARRWLKAPQAKAPEFPWPGEPATRDLFGRPLGAGRPIIHGPQQGPLLDQ